MSDTYVPSLTGCALALSLLFSPSASIAGEVWEEHHLLIESRQEIGTLGPDLFGDQVSFYSGGASFSATDVDVPGNNALPVRLTRVFASPSDSDYKSDGAFGDWSIEIPHIAGIYAESTGWVSAVASRCAVTSNVDAIPPVVNHGGTHFSAADYWRGVELNIPGVSSQNLAIVGASTAQKPATGAWYWVNNDWTYVGCLSSVLNEPGGEGFLARAADGTRYWFNWMAAGDVPHVTKPSVDHESGRDGHPALARKRYALYATRVEDRFGNRVDYTYANTKDENVRLTRIESSDGRTIDLSYNASGQVSSVSSHGRTWNYTYANGSLTEVTLPDSSKWQIDFSGFKHAGVGILYELAYNQWWPNRESDSTYRTCEMPPMLDPEIKWTGTITHPSGAVGEFTFAPREFGRTNVRKVCACSGADSTSPGCGWGGGPGSDVNYEYSAEPYRWHSIALTRKRITGPGLSPAEWQYGYHSESGWEEDNHFGYSATTVLGPDDERVRYVFGNAADATEGLLIRQETGSHAGAVLRSANTGYRISAAGQPYPQQVGDRIFQSDFTATSLRPVESTTTVDSGATFRMQVHAFDSLARATDVSRWSEGQLGAQTRQTTEYFDQHALWVLGQTRRVVDVGTGLEVSRAVYDAATALPTHRYSFDGLVHRLFYRADGTVSRIQDALNKNTDLNQWKRGIPQQVVFHDASTRSAVVNDRGEITAFTDEVGNTHQYQYDAMGRMKQITYPSGGEVTWLSTNFDFVQVPSSEFGIAAGHWRQTISRGGYRKIRYFDAMWRPLIEQEFDSANESGTRRLSAWAYDHQGRVTFQAYPRSSATSLASFVHGVHTGYDALGRVRTVVQDTENNDTAVTRIDYLSDAKGLFTQVLDPKLNRTRTWFQAFDAPSEDAPVRIEHPEGVTTLIDRDVFGKPRSITRSGSFDGASQSLARRYVYDARQRLCKQIEPEAGSTVMAYDAAGNLSWSAGGMALPSTSACDLGGVPVAARTLRGYDARNRLDTLSFPDGLGDQVWSYTPDGLVEQITTANANGEIVVNAYQYNNRRLLTWESLGLAGGAAREIHYGYTAHGHPSRIVHPTDLEVAFAPNALGQPTRAGSHATAVSYHPNGAVKQFTYGNGIVHTLVQNTRGLPQRRRDVGGGVTALDDNYVYDHSGNVAAILDGLPGARGDRVMAYDGLDRLTGTESPMFGQAVYRYDALDNLRRVKINGLAARDHIYHYNATQRLDRITRTDTGATVSLLDYDAQGNLSKRDGTDYAFDFGNRLRAVSGLESYVYDGHGRRVRSTHATQGDIHSFYGQDGVLRYQRDDRTGKVSDYIYLAGAMVARVITPLPPEAPVLTGPGSDLTGSYTISWAAVPLADSYQVEERFNGGSWIQVHNGATTSVSLSGKVTGTYEYRGRACNGSACSPDSALVSVAVTRPPTSAPALTVPSTNTTGSYSVSWTTVTHASTYQLQERLDGGTWSTIQNTSATSRSLSGKGTGDWGYRVRACNAAGCGSFSSIGTVAVTRAPTAAPALTVPSSNTTGSYSVSWTTVTDGATYQLQERLNGGGWSTIQNTSATSRSLSGKSTGDWGYQVRACNSSGCGSWSSIGTVAVTRAPTAAPALTVPSTNTTGSYSVSWTTVTDGATYQLQERFNGGTWSDIQNTSATSRSLTGKSTGDWGYRVRACNAVGCGSFSSIGTVGVTRAPTAAPALTVPSTNTSGSYSVSWTTVTDGATYQLQERFNGGTWSNIQNTSATSRSLSGKSTGDWGYQVRACNSVGCGSWSSIGTVAVTRAPTAAPALTVPSTNTTGSYSVSWTTVTDGATYQLQERLNSGGWSTIQNTSATSRSLSGKSTGDWGYQVRACNSSGCGSWSSIGTVAVTRAPTAAPALTVPSTNTTGSYSVSWTTVTDGATYQLQERFNGGGWSNIQNTSATSRSLSGKSTGDWGYQVRACNSVGCGSWSSIGTVAVTRAPTAAPALTVPSFGLSGSYSVSWTTVTDGATYQLQERFNGGTWSNIQNTSATSRAFSGKAAGHWGYQVRACNSVGCGSWSSIETVEVVYPPASAPSLTVPSSNNTGSYTVSWTSVATATRYELQERLNSGTWSTIQNTSATSRAISGKGNGTWGYRVRACNIAGCSSYSSIASVVVTLPPSTAPSISTSTAGYGQVTVSWTTVATATTYRLEYRLSGGTWSEVQNSSATSREFSLGEGGHEFRVRACNVGGCGPYSSVVSVYVPPPSGGGGCNPEVSWDCQDPNSQPDPEVDL